MSNPGISRSTVILRVQNSSGVLQDPTMQLSDGSVAINAYMKGGVIDSKTPTFTLVRSNVTTADTSFPTAGSGISLAGATTAIVDVSVTGDNPTCTIRPLTYNTTLGTYVAGDTSGTLTEPTRVLTPVFSSNDFFCQVVSIGSNTIVSIAVGAV